MRRIALLLTLALLAPAPPRHAAAAQRAARLSDEEKAYCESEIALIERRRKVFLGQGLAEREAERRNEAPLRALEECRNRLRAEQRRAREEKQDMEEVTRRLRPDATEKEREQAWREIRRERLASRAPSSLTPVERAELAAGMQEELAATHATLDGAHARDPAFMRTVHSALACCHRDRKEDLETQIASEQALLELGTGDRQKLYGLRSALRESRDVLARTREAARGYADGLERCASPRVALIAHCLALRLQGGRAEPACESEEIQQYLRFVK